MIIDGALTPYQVQEGERWDNVAFKAYGDPSLTKPIIAANPTVSITDTLPSGLVLYIPVLTPDDMPDTPTQNNPPWAQ